MPLALSLLMLAASRTAPLDAGYRIQPLALGEVRFDDAFWAPRLARNAKVTIPFELDECEKTGRLENFRAAAGDAGAKYSGYYFDDSDVYKVLEAAAYSLALYPDAALKARCDRVIALIARAQEPDGYLHTSTQAAERGQASPSPKTRWTAEPEDHELYCAGHLYEAGAAYFRATGERSLLDVARRNADLVCRTFRPGGDPDVSGHEEIELGLMKLYALTGALRYRDEAKRLIDERGDPARPRLYGAYAQDDEPVVDQPSAEGHAVRASYLYIGMSDVAASGPATGYRAALDRFWSSVADKMIYATGGIGSTGANEGFTGGYDLPNATAYCETCASVANAMWNQRMFQTEGDAKYLDVAERTLYNAFLSGVGLDGKSFFYPNVLTSFAGASRSPWFDCACCPPNLARLLPTLSTWAFAKSANRLYANLYAGCVARTELGGAPLRVVERTRYPWDGEVRLSLSLARPRRFELALRIPGWARGEPMPGGLYRFADRGAAGWTVEVNGKRAPARLEKGYAVLSRVWRAGDAVTLRLPMPVRRLSADPRVKDDAGRVAFQRGPIVFCAEFADQPGGHVLDVMVPPSAPATARFAPKLLGGVETVRVRGELVARDGAGAPVGSGRAEPLTLIPYADWANRGPGPMTVWLASQAGTAVPAPGPTLVRTARLSASYGHGLPAIADQILPRTSDDHDCPYFHFWPHKGTTEWVRLDLAKPSLVSEARVYWFQDEGTGECRLPAAWTVWAKVDGRWVQASTGDSDIAKDRWCVARFAPARASAIRLEVRLRAGWSTGIQELELR